MNPSEYLWSFLLFIGLVYILLSLNSCGSMQLKSDPKAYGKIDARGAGVENIIGADFSSSSSTSKVDLYGVQINSPTIVVKAFENVTKIDITLYKDESKTSWLMYILLVLILGNFVILVIHLKRI